MCEKYNGWSNYPTWCVKSWLDNDNDFYYDVAQQCWNDAQADEYFTREERAKLNLSESLKDYINDEDINPLIDEASLYSDLLGWAIDSVDWHEIATEFINDLDKEVDTDAED